MEWFDDDGYDEGWEEAVEEGEGLEEWALDGVIPDRVSWKADE